MTIEYCCEGMAIIPLIKIEHGKVYWMKPIDNPPHWVYTNAEECPFCGAPITITRKAGEK